MEGRKTCLLIVEEGNRIEHEKRIFPAELQREAIRFVETSGKPLAHVARDLGISDTTLQGWKQQFKEHGQEKHPGSGHQTPQVRRDAPIPSGK
jgi:transposase